MRSTSTLTDAGFAFACAGSSGSVPSTPSAVACAALDQREPAGVERVEVERLAPEGGLVGERYELAALDEGAADVDGGADDDE